MSIQRYRLASLPSWNAARRHGSNRGRQHRGRTRHRTQLAIAHIRAATSFCFGSPLTSAIYGDDVQNIFDSNQLCPVSDILGCCSNPFGVPIACAADPQSVVNSHSVRQRRGLKPRSQQKAGVDYFFSSTFGS
jgi:hypothetical protein